VNALAISFANGLAEPKRKLGVTLWRNFGLNAPQFTNKTPKALLAFILIVWTLVDTYSNCENLISPGPGDCAWLTAPNVQCQQFCGTEYQIHTLPFLNQSTNFKKNGLGGCIDV